MIFDAKDAGSSPIPAPPQLEVAAQEEVVEVEEMVDVCQELDTSATAEQTATTTTTTTLSRMNSATMNESFEDSGAAFSPASSSSSNNPGQGSFDNATAVAAASVAINDVDDGQSAVYACEFCAETFQSRFTHMNKTKV